MIELKIKIPEEFKLDEKTKLELEKDLESVVRLRLAKNLILKRLDELLKDSKLTEEECLKLGKDVNTAMIKKMERKRMALNETCGC